MKRNFLFSFFRIIKSAGKNVNKKIERAFVFLLTHENGFYKKDGNKKNFLPNIQPTGDAR